MRGAQSNQGDGGGSGRHKRLFGLWLICLLFGLAAVFNFLLALAGTVLGKVVFGVFAALFLASAVGLWMRRRWGWLTAVVLWPAALALELTFEPDPSSAVTVVALE